MSVATRPPHREAVQPWSTPASIIDGVVTQAYLLAKVLD
jgi:hypothetical protein